MIYLVNRNAASRVECLHALVKHIARDPRLSGGFRTSQEIKVQDSGPRITECCSLLVIDHALNLKYCPYKQNALDLGVCHLTNSVMDDSTKSKESSNSLNSLVALGLLERDGNDRLVLTSAGIAFAGASVGDDVFTSVLYEGVTNYGPAVGLLAQLVNNPKLLTNSANAIVGYPNSAQRVIVDGRVFELPVGSKKDSNTRTRSVLLKWLVASGCLEPVAEVPGQGGPASKYRDYLNAKDRPVGAFRLTSSAQKLFSVGKPHVERPLDFLNSLKGLSLRERRQKVARDAALKYAGIVRNRRALIALLFDKASRNTTGITSQYVLDVMRSNPESFFVENDQSLRVVESEVEYAFAVGTPFVRDSDGRMIPLTTINTSRLLSTADTDSLELLKACL